MEIFYFQIFLAGAYFVAPYPLKTMRPEQQKTMIINSVKAYFLQDINLLRKIGIARSLI